MLSLYNLCVCEYRPSLLQTRKIDDANYFILLRRHTTYIIKFCTLFSWYIRLPRIS